MDTVPPLTPGTPPPAPSTEDNTVAVVSYLTLIGFIVAIVMHGNKKTRLGAYHLRQSLGLLVVGVAVWIVAVVLAFVPIVGWLVSFALWVGLFALWLMGLIAAASRQMKPVPVLGEHFQKWFSTAFE